MKTVLLYLGMMCPVFIAHSQGDGNFVAIDRIALDIPVSQTNSTDDIAAYISYHFDSENKKIRAIYAWVVANIKYSSDSLHRVILNEDKEELVTFALRRRKGVCQNFAAIFVDLCKKCGLNAYVVEGYTKQNSSVDRSGHAWCVAFVDNKWLLYDPTWDAVPYMRSYPPIQTSYFQVEPSEFIQTHLPFDPMFQLLDYPLTYKEFENGYIKQNGKTAYFNYKDSINKYENLNPLERYISSSSRIEKNGMPDKMISTKLTQMRLEIEVIYQDYDSALYNGAIADYNYAIKKFNDFLTYRNNQFKPEKTDAEVQGIFDDIEKRIASARTKLMGVNQSIATLTLDTGDIEYALNNLTAHVKEQRDFLRNYKTTANDK